jgi:hypothetical protein
MVLPPSTGRVLSQITSTRAPAPRRRRVLRLRVPAVQVRIPPLRRLLGLRARRLRPR